jgi:hypothetical protein
MKKLLLTTTMMLLGSCAAQAQQCPDLWKYVYSPQRFSSDRSVPKIPPCVTYEGRVRRLPVLKKDPQGRYYSDGDISFSIIREDGSIVVVEQICAEPERIHSKNTPGPKAVERAAGEACGRYRAAGHKPLYSRRYINSLVGKRVAITGFSVTDYGHDHPKKEIHPLTGIRVIPGR